LTTLQIRRIWSEVASGTFSDALMTEAKEKKWTVISMQDDWNKIFTFESK
jgi:hypothetical protein